MTFLELLSWTIWDATRPRKLVLMAILVAVGPIFAILISLAGEGGTEAGYSLVVQLAIYQFTMVLLSIVFACSAVSGEVTGRTISFLVTRPVSRAQILVAKFVGASIIVAIASCVACLLTGVLFETDNIGFERIQKDLYVLPVGAIVYCAVFTCLSALLVRPVLVAVFYTFAFESWVWVIPGDFPKLSLMTYLRALGDHSPPDAGAPAGIVDVLAQLSPTMISKDQAWTTLALVAVVAIALGVIAFSRGEYVPKEEAA